VIGDVSASLAESARVKQGSAKINLDAVSWSSPVGLECTIGAVTCFFLWQGGLSGGDTVLVCESAEDLFSADPVLGGG
jgi:hypothetical protein